MLCSLLWYRSVDKTVIYTLADHSNQEAVLERYDKVKDLGVWFDEKLSFREHIQDKINKAYMMLGPVCMPVLGLCWHCVGKLHYGLPAPGLQRPSTVVARCSILAGTPALCQHQDE